MYGQTVEYIIITIGFYLKSGKFVFYMKDSYNKSILAGFGVSICNKLWATRYYGDPLREHIGGASLATHASCSTKMLLPSQFRMQISFSQSLTLQIWLTMYKIY
jgi:hypothetical protein